MLGSASGCDSVPVAESLHGLSKTAEQVPSIGNLDCARGTLADTVATGTGTITRDDLNTWTVTQPSCDGSGFAIG